MYLAWNWWFILGYLIWPLPKPAENAIITCPRQFERLISNLLLKSMGKLTGVVQLKVDLVYLPHINFIIMTTNRKKLNGERINSIQIDLAGPQWMREERAGDDGRGRDNYTGEGKKQKRKPLK